MKRIVVLLLLFIIGCSPYNHFKKYYTNEDKTVFELVQMLKRNAADTGAAKLLPLSYAAAINKRKGITQADYKTLPPGDRYMQMVKEWSVMQQMYDQINAVTAAKLAVPLLWDPAIAIQNAKQKAAKEYYNQGLDYLDYNTRQTASSAYDYFSKANDAVPGYENVEALMKEALEKATIRVLVRPVGYYNNSWSYWGYQNDWLQQQMVNDLNAQSYREVKFYTELDLNAQQIQPDKTVELNFTQIFPGQMFSNNYTVQRSKEIQNGSTRNTDGTSKPTYKTVYATVHVTRRYMQSNALLECRIFDNVTGANLLYDQFPSNDNWSVETATYTGDAQALTSQDLSMINNSAFANPPNRNDIVSSLIRNSYYSLLNRIKTGVKFEAY